MCAYFPLKWNKINFVKNKTKKRNIENSAFFYVLDFDAKYFWSWTDFQSYLDFMLLVWAIGAAITYLLLSIEWFMETIGFLAVFTEAMLGKTSTNSNLETNSYLYPFSFVFFFQVLHNFWEISIINQHTAWVYTW